MTRYLIQLVVDFISPRQLSELDETLAVPCLRLDDALIVLTDTNIMCRVVQNLAQGSSEILAHIVSKLLHDLQCLFMQSGANVLAQACAPRYSAECRSVHRESNNVLMVDKPYTLLDRIHPVRHRKFAGRGRDL